MKKSNYFLPIFLFFLLTFSPVIENIALAQNNEEKKVRVKIMTKENGNAKMVDTTFSIGELDDVENILEELNIEIKSELGEIGDHEKMEIIIKKSIDGLDLDEMQIEIDPEEHWQNISCIKKPSHGFLGVNISDIVRSEGDAAEIKSSGVHIEKVIAETGAEAAGLKAGDIITHINEMEVNNYSELVRELKKTKPGDVIQVGYTRDSQGHTTQATLGEAPNRQFMMGHSEGLGMLKWHDEGGRHFFDFKCIDELSKPMLGVKLAEPDEGTDGIKINGVIDETAASEMGLQQGDIITAINGTEIGNAEELINAISDMAVGEKITVKYLRNGNQLESSGTLTGRTSFMKGMDHFHLEGTEEMLRELEESLQNMEFDFDFDEDELHEKLKKVEGMNYDWDAYFERAFGEKDGMEIRSFTIVIEMDDLSDVEAKGLNISNDNNLEIESLRFSPNPGNGQFNLSFYLPEEGKTMIRVFDSAGNQVYKEKLNKFSGSYNGVVDISAEPKGIYFLQVEQNGKSISKKLVVQ